MMTHAVRTNSVARRIFTDITTGPHWRISMRPCSRGVAPSHPLDVCWDQIHASRVALRGRDFPYVDRWRRTQGPNWVSCWGERGGERECWRCTRGAEWLHVRAFAEDVAFEKIDRLAKRYVAYYPDDLAEPTGYLDVFWTADLLVEIALFATRLAASGFFGRELRLTIALEGIRHRAIFSNVRDLNLHNQYYATEESIARTWLLNSRDAESRTAILATEAASWLFRQFHWERPPLPAIQARQQGLLAMGS